MTGLKGRQVVVMGLGSFGGGTGAARFLVEQGARVLVTDLRSAESLKDSVDALRGMGIALKLGGHDASDFETADLVVANPAVPRSSPYLRIAECAGVPVTTEICLFVERCPAAVTGVTGSSGKTTTVSLLSEMVAGRHPDVRVGGNIGGSLLDELDSIGPNTRIVLELSSFQLDRLGDMGWSPDVCVVTNFAPNHLDVHGSIEAYRAAKLQIVAHRRLGSVGVMNDDDPEVRSWVPAEDPRRIGFSLEHPVGQGVWEASGRILRAWGKDPEELCRTDAVRLKGRHNLANALAAAGAATAMEIPTESIERALRHFAGVPHRLEEVGMYRGALYLNDSIATTPGRTQVALESIAGNIVLIAGGYDKGLSYATLGRDIGEKVSHLILIGQTADKIAESIPKEASVPVSFRDSLEDAVVEARETASEGDTVLLSPASASYDMFRNFEERGTLFKQLVREPDREESRGATTRP